MTVLRWSLLLLVCSAFAGAGVRAGTPEKKIPEPKVIDGYLQLDFYWLSFYPFVEPDIDHQKPLPAVLPTGNEQIPAPIMAWSGKKVALTGYVLPTKLVDSKATEILLMPNLMLCCYGTVPKMNDLVIVKVPGGTPVVQDTPITFRGTFKVGAQFQDGYITGVYELDADGPGKINN